MTKTAVLHPERFDGDAAGRDPRVRLREAVGLAAALDLDIVLTELSPVKTPRASTLYGPGKVAELGAALTEADAALAIVDAHLTPVQQRNLERAWKLKVLDRTALILEIFGDRAQTREGVLQVELAHLEYQKSRLVRSWTHLERQRGGVGFLGGPGETQIEADRRILGERIVALRRRLAKVARTRELHRAARKRAPYPVVALVGYTNAGKSTLFNRLTQADVLAKDMLFATLDPTMRAIALPSGRKVILSDTVGFISDLPTQLVAAFRATLEEVLAADVIVHVRDIADPETDAQKADVLSVLEELGVDDAGFASMLEARNKIDLLEPEERRAALNEAERCDGVTCLSAVSGDGLPAFLRAVEQRLTEAAQTFEIVLAGGDGAALAWLHDAGCVVDRVDRMADIALRVRMTEIERGQFEKRFPDRMSASASRATAAE